jgi:hypothetical protein
MQQQAEKITVHCGHCKATLSVAATLRGKTGKCPKCQQPVLIDTVPAPVDELELQLPPTRPPVPVEHSGQRIDQLTTMRGRPSPLNSSGETQRKFPVPLVAGAVLIVIVGAIAMWKMNGTTTPLPVAPPDSTSARKTQAVDTDTLAAMKLNHENAIAACRAYTEAQEIYRRKDYDSDGLLEYAQSIKGDHSLVDKKAGDGALGLLTKAHGAAEGDPGQATPLYGYCFKVLKKQGSNPIGGARDYVVGNNMVLGYALVAYPAEYNKTGCYTFLINNMMNVFQKDLGAETHAIVKAMTEFNPDKSWQFAE